MESALATYLKAEDAYDKALNNIIRNPQVIENIRADFKKMYPKYYINGLSHTLGGLYASIYRKSDNKLVDGMGFPLSDGTWSFNR